MVYQQTVIIDQTLQENWCTFKVNKSMKESHFEYKSNNLIDHVFISKLDTGELIKHLFLQGHTKSSQLMLYLLRS